VAKKLPIGGVRRKDIEAEEEFGGVEEKELPRRGQ